MSSASVKSGSGAVEVGRSAVTALATSSRHPFNANLKRSKRDAGGLLGADGTGEESAAGTGACSTATCGLGETSAAISASAATP